MDAAVKQKIDTWLKGNYDEKTKNKIKRLQDQNNETELTLYTKAHKSKTKNNYGSHNNRKTNQ